MFEGGCHCAKIRYRMTSGPMYVNCCHCRDCQRQSGSAFALNAMIETDRIEIIGEAEPVVDAEGMRRCPHCETALWAFHPMFGEAIAFLRAGTLDEGEHMRPDAHFFLRSKHPWITIPEGARTYETLPSDQDPLSFGPEAKARLHAAMRG